MEKRVKKVGIMLTEDMKNELDIKTFKDHITISSLGEILFENYLNGKISISVDAGGELSVFYNEGAMSESSADRSSAQTESAESAEPLYRSVLRRKKTASFTIRVDPKQRDALNARAKEEGFSTSKLIDILFENYLNGNIKIRLDEKKSKTL